MATLRRFEAEVVFERAWRGWDEAAEVVEAAYRAARRGRLEEVEACLARLEELAPALAGELAGELREIVRSVRDHPSWRPGP